MGGPVQGGAAPVGHGEPPAGSIGDHVQADMAFRVAPSGPTIPRRKHRPDKGDDADGARAAIRHRINVPPGVAVRTYRPVEPRSVSTACAANLPDSAAIGTPGPGCAPPPRQIQARHRRPRRWTEQRCQHPVRAAAIKRPLAGRGQAREIPRHGQRLRPRHRVEGQGEAG